MSQQNDKNNATHNYQTKKSYLHALRRLLRQLRRSELKKQLEYYDELISDMVESGLSEAAAVGKLSSPKEIARDILQEASPLSLQPRNWAGRSLTALSLILLICCVILYFKRNMSGPISHSISIIGGADGPTSVFIAGKIGGGSLLYYITFGCIGITVIYHLIRYWKYR